MEGALRKLGVDPDTIVGNHNISSEEADIDEQVLDPDLCTPFNVVAVPANDEDLENSGEDSLHLADRTAMGRLRHLDILEEVSKLATGSKIM